MTNVNEADLRAGVARLGGGPMVNTVPTLIDERDRLAAELAEQKSLNLNISHRLAAASECLGRAAERRAEATPVVAAAVGVRASLLSLCRDFKDCELVFWPPVGKTLAGLESKLAAALTPGHAEGEQG